MRAAAVPWPLAALLLWRCCLMNIDYLVVTASRVLRSQISIVKNKPHNGAVKTLHDGKGKRPHIAAVKNAHQRSQHAHAVFDKHAYLPHARRIAPAFGDRSFSNSPHANHGIMRQPFAKDCGEADR